MILWWFCWGVPEVMILAMILWWFFDDFSDDFLMIFWWFSDDFGKLFKTMIFWWFSDDLLMIWVSHFPSQQVCSYPCSAFLTKQYFASKSHAFCWQIARLLAVSKWHFETVFTTRSPLRLCPGLFYIWKCFRIKRRLEDSERQVLFSDVWVAVAPPNTHFWA